MKVEEVAVRQEVRQLLAEAGINRDTIREMAQAAIQEAVDKQVNIKLESLNIPLSVNRAISGAVREAARGACRKAAIELLKGATITLEDKK